MCVNICNRQAILNLPKVKRQGGKILGIVMECVDNMIQGIQKIKTGKMSVAPSPPNGGGGVILLYLKR